MLKELGRREGTLSISTLKGCFNQKHYTAFILGSGESLPSAIRKIKKVPVDKSFLISVNQRPLKLIKKVDVIVSGDVYESQLIWERFKTHKNLSEYSKKKNPILISTWDRYSDFILEDFVWWGGYSSMTACYLACYMGFMKVVLMGMDCYQGKTDYFDGLNNRNGVIKMPLENHLEMWEKAFQYCPDAKVKIRAINNPLIELFGEWNTKNRGQRR